MSLALLAPPRDLAPGLENAFEHVPSEREHEVGRVQGVLPEWLSGSYYLNGPARFERGGLRYKHWLDGDGMVAALHFDAGRARFVSRFVRTPRFEAEEQAGRALYRAFGTAFPGDRLVRDVALASPANVSVLPLHGRLLALGEQGLPIELDPRTLESRGVCDFDGALGELSPFSAHPKLDTATGELYNFGVSFARNRPLLHFYRFDRQGRLIVRRPLPLGAPRSLHDFALSRRHATFHLGAYVLDMATLQRPGGTLLEALSLKPELGSRLMVLSSFDGAPVATIELHGGYCLHLLQACEDPKAPHLLSVDFLELDRPVYDQYRLSDMFSEAPAGRPVRVVLDLRSGSLVARHEVSYESCPDFATVEPGHPGELQDDFWMLGQSQAGRSGRKFFDELVHARWSRPRQLDVWRAPRGQYLAGEPLPLGRSGGGLLLCPLYDAQRHTTEFLLFEAQAVSAGPRAVLTLEEPLHLAFHAAWVPTDPEGGPK